MLQVLLICVWYDIRCFTEIKVDWIFIILLLPFNLTLLSVKYQPYCFLLVGSKDHLIPALSYYSFSLTFCLALYFNTYFLSFRYVCLEAWPGCSPTSMQNIPDNFVPLSLRNTSPPSFSRLLPDDFIK